VPLTPDRRQLETRQKVINALLLTFQKLAGSRLGIPTGFTVQPTNQRRRQL